MLWHALLVVGSLGVLVLGARLLVAGASAIAERAGVPPLLIGLTVVGCGTSMPEFATSLLAAGRGIDGLVVGNLVGSNIFNLAVILGATAVLRPIPVPARFVRRETLLVIAVATVPFATIFTGGELGRLAGLLLLLGFALYLRRAIRESQTDASTAATTAPITASAPAPKPIASNRKASNILRVILGLGLLVFGSQWMVQSATALALGFGLSDLVIGLTVVAAGTSAPELVTSIIAARRGQMDLAVGNIFGSNMFNLLGILGATCLVQPQQVPRQTLVLDAPVMLAFSLAMLPLLLSQGRLSRAEGVLLLTAYAAYLAYLLS